MAHEDDSVEAATAAAALLEDDFGGFNKESNLQPRGMLLQVFDGQLCQKSNVPVQLPGWDIDPVETTNQTTKEKKLTWVNRFDNVVAKIIDVDKEKVTFEKTGNSITNYNFTLLAGGKKGTLQLTYMDSVLKRFMKVAPNIKFDQHLLISAWSSTDNREGKGNRRKQAVSFRQGVDANDKEIKQWTKVPEYWVSPKDEQGHATGDAIGADGSVMPRGIFDDEDESWDYKAQNKFLSTYFRDNILPKIKANAEKYKDIVIPVATPSEEPLQEFSGPIEATGTTAPAVDYSVKPDNPVSSGVADAMTGEQAAAIKKMCKTLGEITGKNIEAEAVSQKMLDVSFHTLNRAGAGYLGHKLTKRIAKARAKLEEEAPTAAAIVAPVMPPAPEPNPPVVPVPAPKAKADEDDDDDWEPASAPKAAEKPKTGPMDDDDDVPF